LVQQDLLVQLVRGEILVLKDPMEDLVKREKEDRVVLLDLLEL